MKAGRMMGVIAGVGLGAAALGMMNRNRTQNQSVGQYNRPTNSHEKEVLSNMAEESKNELY
ncbi:hypothetical protein [Scopulibacillus cellulosilyticus]|uniref:YtxH domain-containing protein n=1 Tax=Scopulibacillus cellulosilyticus TaxID=2665665 RepID=A0ABW2PQT0_9BACL